MRVFLKVASLADSRRSWLTGCRRAMSPSLIVDRQTSHGGKRVSHGFPDCGMGMDREHHVIDGSLELQGRHGLSQNLRRLRPDNMHAQNLAGCLVRHNFDESIVMI